MRVQQLEERLPGLGRVTHVKVYHDPGDPPLDWDALQALKDAFVGPGEWAVEVYPAADQVVDDAPIRHLWVVDAAWLAPLNLRAQVEGR